MEDVTDNPYMKVFKRWAETMEPVVGKGNLSMSRSKTLMNSEKYARIFPLGNPALSTALGGEECATSLSFQVDSFARDDYDAQDTVFAVDAASHDCMVGMGFRRTYGPELLSDEGDNVQRVTSRYSRTYTGQLLGEGKA